MAKKLVSWILAGAFSYLWWWVGYSWTYLNPPDDNGWSAVFVAFTLISLVVLSNQRSGS